MKKTFLCAIAALSFLTSAAQRSQPAVAVIPEPVSVQTLAGQVTITPQTKIFSNSDDAAKSAALFNAFLEANYGFSLQEGTMRNSMIVFSEDKVLPKEGYQLTVARNKVVLQGRAAGLFYAVQTLQQLVTSGGKNKVTVPGVLIKDQPRFAYRGLMLDVGRYFFPVSYVKQFIDVMAHYKLNRFHWHLTEDQGWRIEIKKYPKLQSVASKRASTMRKTAQGNKPDGQPYGGFYTQEEVKEIVAYAQERHVTVIPEIEMPGHATAALAAYPYLGCTGGPYEVSTHWGVHKEVYCAGNDSVYAFLEDVLEEILPLFPGEYIHIGGDECPKDRWKTCPKCQARIRELGLKDEHELQSYFIQRMEKFLNSKGRRIIGWDEILEGGLAPNATVMSWRGEKGGIAAARQKHDVIMTPNTYLYLDYYQADPSTEPPAIGGYVPIEKVYRYEPYHPGLTAAEQKYIKGIQGNVWTEYIPDEATADYFTWPRALAVAEVAWSPAAKKNYKKFSSKLPKALAALDKQEVNFRVPEPVGFESTVITTANITVSLKAPITGATIRYTTDGSEPTVSSRLYTKPFIVAPPANGSTTVKCIVITRSGRKSAVYSATYTRKSYKTAASVHPVKKGVRFEAFYRNFNSVKNIGSGKADTTGSISGFSIRPFLAKPAFGVQYDGYIKIEQDGLYTFTTSSDDGSMLMIGDEVVVNNDGEHAPTAKSGMIPLRKGFHRIRVSYFDLGGDQALQVSVSLKGKQSINLQHALFH